MLSTGSRIARTSSLKGCSKTYQRAFGWSCPSHSHHPNAPIPLVPSLQALLRDVDLSLHNHKTHPRPELRELEATPIDSSETNIEAEIVEEITDLQRKSPAALYGSQQIGQVVLPLQLQTAITSIINDSDKHMLHSDAKRLFAETDSDGQQAGWQIQLDTRYRSRKQGARHAERDATAFASIALPAHYSAIFAVFENLRQRMPPNWEVERLIDWGAGTANGLWASLFSFQSEHQRDMLDVEASASTLRSYLGIDRREGLLSIAKRIGDSIPTSEQLSVQFQKSFKEGDRVSPESGSKTIALSAFMLSSLTTPIARKALVKEMWNSGAHTLVLIDHNTREGFESIVQAREYLLRQGRKELEAANTESLSIRGAHVVAPCPHDGACPLHNAGAPRLVCGFSQRLQRPEFVRLTKRSGVGHEDVEYSYVVIQRGPRPSPIATSIGRIGLVGRKAIADQESKSVELKELRLFEEGHVPLAEEAPSISTTAAAPAPIETEASDSPTSAELQNTFRQEAYHWPRLVFPPMKKSGHVILDSCTSEGKIMRLTIPKSQGKQPFYDARKSTWGDLFPHPPKNPPQERVVIHNSIGEVKAVERSHIGKSGTSKPKAAEKVYESLSNTIREAKKKNRRWERYMKADQVWKADD